MTRRWAPPTCYTLRRITASIMKGLNWLCCRKRICFLLVINVSSSMLWPIHCIVVNLTSFFFNRKENWKKFLRKRVLAVGCRRYVPLCMPGTTPASWSLQHLQWSHTSACLAVVLDSFRILFLCFFWNWSIDVTTELQHTRRSKR